jgi:squalene-hopene/tetraprenyl-beta-curcumene cyclase
MVDDHRLAAAYEQVRGDLLRERVAQGHWIGELASSALSTATAVSALALVRRHAATSTPSVALDDTADAHLMRLIVGGLHWLADAQNADGGWGDTDRSLSNIATTMLVQAAFRLTGLPAAHAGMWERAEAFVAAQGGVPGLRKRYGRDKTFAVPILTNCALAGLVSWKEVSPLPFELACLPQSFYRFLRLPVVSYAIPALVAIGQARYVHRPPINPVARVIRKMALDKSLAVLERLQPTSGGFLEATPLTSFVVMSLAGIGRVSHPVVHKGVEFLLGSVRQDGSWPIDTNLATWNTTLAVNALAESGEDVGELDVLDWLLGCQNRELHPYTGAVPGGWGWSDLAGAVPDADDTAGALLALVHLFDRRTADGPRIADAAGAGLDWLLGLQNGDGGWPTFCRGWGTMPFDRSGTDLTAHALRAMDAWRDRLGQEATGGGAGPARNGRIEAAVRRGLDYLAKSQRSDGSWVPLWFGNQYHPEEENPVYGTAKVLLAYRDLRLMDCEAARRGLAWLVGHQNMDGGWGGARENARPGKEPPRSSTEETALAIEALLAGGGPSESAAAQAGMDWLVEAVEGKVYRESSPIGFYFAKLWYYERLYPLTFAASALGRALRRLHARREGWPTVVHSAEA